MAVAIGRDSLRAEALADLRDDFDELRFLCCCAPPYRHEDTYFE